MTAGVREWRGDDADDLWDAVASSPDLSLQFGPATPLASPDCAGFIARRLGSDQTRTNWAIVLGGRAVGNVGVSRIDRGNDIGWVCYWLASAARGRGLAAAALRSLARHCFDDLGLFRLELGHRVNNPASCHVALAAGFAIEGVERLKLRYGTERFDTETHARLRTDTEPAGRLLARAV